MSGAKKGVAVKLVVGKFEHSVSPELPTHGSGIMQVTFSFSGNWIDAENSRARFQRSLN